MFTCFVSVFISIFFLAQLLMEVLATYQLKSADIGRIEKFFDSFLHVLREHLRIILLRKPEGFLARHFCFVFLLNYSILYENHSCYLKLRNVG